MNEFVKGLIPDALISPLFDFAEVQEFDIELALKDMDQKRL